MRETGIKKIGRDKEEVRLEHPVPQLLQAYGVKIKGNRYMPFCHPANTYSGKFDDRSCFCYVCGKMFDCFSVVGFFEGIDNLYDQINFLGGEELPEDDPKRMKLKAKAQRIRAEKKAEMEKKDAFNRQVNQLTNQIHELRKSMQEHKPLQTEWPSQEWVDAYNKLQILDYQVGTLLGDEKCSLTI